VDHRPNPTGKCIVLSLSIQLFQLFRVEIYSQKMIFPFLLFRYYNLPCPTSFHSPISCTYFCYGPREPQSQSIWKTHLHFQGYVTNYYFFHIFQIKLFFCLLIYLCVPRFLSSAMLNVKSFCLFYLNSLFFLCIFSPPWSFSK
jgi:hypothetical protein